MNNLTISDQEKKVLDIITLGDVQVGEGFLRDIADFGIETIKIVFRLKDLGLVSTEDKGRLWVELTRKGWDFAQANANSMTRDTLFVKRAYDSYRCNMEIIRDLWVAQSKAWTHDDPDYTQRDDAMNDWEAHGVSFDYVRSTGDFRWVLGTGGPASSIVFRCTPSFLLIAVVFQHTHGTQVAEIPMSAQEFKLWMNVWRYWLDTENQDSAMRNSIDRTSPVDCTFLGNRDIGTFGGPRMMVLNA